MASALITGANRGIGLALARQLGGRGDQVIAVCRNPPGELNAGNVRVESGVDVTSDQAVAALAGKVGRASLDLLVLNAGILRADSLDGVALEEVRAQIEVNAIAPLRVVVALRPALRPGAKIAVI